MIGPAIGPCCFEVGEEVAQRFLERFPAEDGCRRPAGPAGKSLIDLPAAAILALVDAGVDRRSIRSAELCTRCDPGLFESYRRDGEQAGRMIALIGPRPD